MAVSQNDIFRKSLLIASFFKGGGYGRSKGFGGRFLFFIIFKSIYKIVFNKVAADMAVSVVVANMAGANKTAATFFGSCNLLVD